MRQITKIVLISNLWLIGLMLRFWERRNCDSKSWFGDVGLSINGLRAIVSFLQRMWIFSNEYKIQQAFHKRSRRKTICLTHTTKKGLDRVKIRDLSVLYISSPTTMLQMLRDSLVLFQNHQWGPTTHHPQAETLERESGGKEKESFIQSRGIKLIFTGGHINLTVAFKGPNVTLGLYKCNYSLTRGKELVLPRVETRCRLDKTRRRAEVSPQACVCHLCFRV